MMVLIALAFTALVGITGLAVDLGFVALERRTLQKAADAAAMSGALDLASTTAYGSISSDVSTMVTRNAVGSGTTTNCVLVDNSNAQVQANCGTPADSTTSGVRVALSRPRGTFFMGVVGINTVNVSATSTARVVLHNRYDAGNAPFIVCGLDTKLATSGTMNIVQSTPTLYPIAGTSWYLNPSAVGQNFLIHGPQVATCGAGNNAFKGLADMDANVGITTLPATLEHDTGVQAGPTRAVVNGPNGCGIAEDDGCVMILPVATSITGPPQRDAYSIVWLPFYVTQNGANKHNGRLESLTYQLQLTTTQTGNWTLGQNGLVSARIVS